MSARDSEADHFSEVFDRLVKEAFSTDTLPPENTRFSDAGIDSLGLLSLIMMIEDQLGTPWPVEYLTRINSYDTIAALRETAHAIHFGGNR